MPRKKKSESKKTTAEVVIEPNQGPVLPGNTITFMSDAPDGNLEYLITAAGGPFRGKPSVSNGRARATHLLERGGPLRVEFLADGVVYAEGSWEI